MKNSKKEIAAQRILILFDSAISNARNNPNLAERQAQIARQISMRFKIRMPWQIQTSFCKKCKKFIVPSISSRVRIGRSNVKSIRITCNFCNHTYRKLIPQ
jgi:ribonuclease P protein subunit RPR2